VTADQARRAAHRLRQARLTREAIGSLPEECRPATLDDGYRIQDELHRLLAPDLGPLAGHKIGCTTPVMQAYLGIPHPCAGGVFAGTVHQGAAALRARDYRRVGVECEVAVRLGQDLPPGSGPYDRGRVGEAVAAVMAAIEVVDDRYADFRTLGVPTLIADDFFDAGAILGPEVAGWRDLDLAAVHGTTWIGDREAGRGQGSAVMGHPLEALAWLAEALAARGQGLRAGEIVLLGSVVETRWLEPGDRVRITIDGLGEARATLDS
jgi:2-keto-4-pentenoate hydratase